MRTSPWGLPLAAFAVSIIAVCISFASYRNALKSRRLAEEEYEAKRRLDSVRCEEMEYRPHYRSVLGLKAKNGPGELTVTDAYLHIEFARYERGLVRVHKRIEQLVVDNTKFSFLKIDGPNVADSRRLPPNDEIKWTMPLRQAPDNCSAELIFSVKTASWEVQHSDPYQISGSYNHPRWLPALDEKLPPQEVKTRWHLLRFSKEFRDWVDTW